MAELVDEKLDRTFAALGDGTRRAILSRLAQGEASLSDLAEPFAMSQTAVSKHVRVLNDAGLVIVEKRGRTRFCRLQGEGLGAAADWIDDQRRFWEQSLEALSRFLAEDEKEPSAPRPGQNAERKKR